jgi:hypothetical protein
MTRTRGKQSVFCGGDEDDGADVAMNGRAS